MTRPAAASSVSELSPELARDWQLLAGPNERSTRRRIAWVWALLFFNVLTYAKLSTNLIPLPSAAGKAMAELSLAIVFFLVLSANKRLLVRPNILLILYTALCILAAVMSLRGYFGLNSPIRWFRFAAFMAVLWLMTPWWGRRDHMILQFHRRALIIVMISVVIGIAISPNNAFQYVSGAGANGGRLQGTVWPIPSTQLAHYAAVLVGLTVVMWFAGMLKSKWTGVVILTGMMILILTHTRTALLAMSVGILVAGFSLFLSRQRVRRVLAVGVVVVAIGSLSFAPIVNTWLARGENAQEVHNLSGRTSNWSLMLAQPRTEVNTLFGYGLSYDGYNGLPLDSSWMSTYLDQGLIGDVLDGLVLLSLLIAAIVCPRRPERAIALFLVVYCGIASYTETGLGQPSTYLLDLAVAMAVLMPPLVSTHDPSTSDSWTGWSKLKSRWALT